MNYVITDEEIDIVLYFLKLFFINIGTYYIFLKLINKKKLNLVNVMTLLVIILVTIICTIVKEDTNSINAIILLLILLTFTFSNFTGNTMGYTLITTIFALSISNVLFFASTVLNSIPNIILNIQNDYLAFLFIIIVYILLIFVTMKIKRLEKGASFLNKRTQSEFFDILILNISAMTLFCIIILGNYDILVAGKIGFLIIVLSIIMFVTIKKSFEIYYKQKLLIKELEETKQDLTNKEIEITKLEQENLNFSKKSHSLDHKQKALEYKLNQLILKTETAEELNIKDRLETISKELYEDTVTTELTKTEIPEIDDMLEFMQSECKANNIDFNLQITGNIFHMINNLITKEELEILIADHIKDAIIAIKHTDNINKSILVKLGKIEECYGLYIYDSGIEFEKETLENLGKKPSTTHADEGGTGMGFMNTFDTLRKHKASLIIEEIGETSKDNYTKVIKIKFDNKNEFKINSYKQNKQDDKKQ